MSFLKSSLSTIESPVDNRYFPYEEPPVGGVLQVLLQAEEGLRVACVLAVNHGGNGRQIDVYCASTPCV